MNQKIILASGSRQRKIIMDALGLPYEIIPADIDEKAIRDEDLEIRAEKIARAKAEKVAAEHEGVIIAADTFVELEGEVLEKPVNVEEAREMLAAYSGKETIVYTGFCYLDQKNNITVSTCLVIPISIREMTREEIDEYLKYYPVLQWSGAFSPAYPFGMTLINKINGSFTGFIHGLPTDLLIPLLKKSGFRPHPPMFN